MLAWPCPAWLCGMASHEHQAGPYCAYWEYMLNLAYQLDLGTQSCGSLTSVRLPGLATPGRYHLCAGFTQIIVDSSFDIQIERTLYLPKYSYGYPNYNPHSSQTSNDQLSWNNIESFPDVLPVQAWYLRVNTNKSK